MKVKIKKVLMTTFLIIISSFVFARPPYEHLKGEWEFYLEKTPVQVFNLVRDQGSPDLIVNVPSFWNEDIKTIRGVKYSQTFGCYRKVIKNLNPNQKYALLLKDAPQSACAVYVNKKIVSQNGNPFLYILGRKPKASDSVIKPMYADFYPDKYGNVEITVFISNYIYRKSGLWDSFYLGKKKMLQLLTQ